MIKTHLFGGAFFVCLFVCADEWLTGRRGKEKWKKDPEEERGKA
jgi:hypothetical protein